MFVEMFVEAAVKVAFDTGRILLRLKEKGIIQGKVLQRTGSNGASGANLWLYDFGRSKHVLETMSAYSGGFSFGEVHAGQYRIDVRYGAYTFTDMERLYLGRGKEAFVDIKLPVDNVQFGQSIKIRDKHVALDVVTSGAVVHPTRQHYKDLIFPRAGVRYTVRLTNNSDQKLLGVLTVDGLSVMNGEPGDYYSGGYVLSPHTYTDVPGWRVDDNTVARFVFSNQAESYAALMQRRTNIGVIACAFFEEVDDSGVLYSMPIGTGFGEATEHRVKRVTFNRESAPSVIKRVYYRLCYVSCGQGVRSLWFRRDPSLA